MYKYRKYILNKLYLIIKSIHNNYIDKVDRHNPTL